MKTKYRAFTLSLISGVLAIGTTLYSQMPATQATRAEQALGLKQVIAFTYLADKANPKDLHSVTFLEPTKDWRYWSARGVKSAVGHTWFDLLRNPVDKAVDILTKANYADNPHPIVAIDEFGFDFGGQTDQKAAEILRRTKQARPELALAVWEMRGPIPKVLGEAYRDVASLVMLESYLKDKNEYWWMAAQVQSARIHGILGKTIVCLGVGKGGNEGEIWACTTQELEQQIRFVRLITGGQSPGIGFYSGGQTPELITAADQICARYDDLPTDGSGLPDDVVATAKFFTQDHPNAMIVACPEWVEPDRSAPDPGKLVTPHLMRVYLLNLGDRDAVNVKVALRDPPDKGGNTFAAGLVDVIPAHGEAVAALPVTAKWNSWKKWQMKIEAPDGEIKVFHR